MYRHCSCLYRYSAYIFNIGAYSDPYSSIGATLLECYIRFIITEAAGERGEYKSDIAQVGTS